MNSSSNTLTQPRALPVGDDLDVVNGSGVKALQSHLRPAARSDTLECVPRGGAVASTAQ